MKKLFSKGLSLLLVLVMVLGVMPMASAETINRTLSEAKAGITLTAPAVDAASIPNFHYNSYVWQWDGNEQHTFNSENSYTFTYEAEGTYNVKCDAYVYVGNSVQHSVNTYNYTIVVGPDSDPTVAVTGVTVAPETATVTVGGTANLTATVAPTDATNKNVTWISSNDAVATVADGVVTGVAAGKVTITATSAADNTKKATATITVVDAPYTVTLDTAHVDLIVDGGADSMHQFTATVRDNVNGTTVTNPQIAWSASANSAIELSSTGKVTAKAATTSGNVTITAKYTKDGKDYTATAEVFVTANTYKIVCSDVSVESMSNSSLTSTTLKPTVTLANDKALPADTKVTYSYTGATKSGDYGIVYKSSATNGIATVVITATVTAGGATETVQKTVHVSFYTYEDIDITMKDGLKKFTFSDATAITDTYSLEDQIRASVTGTPNAMDVVEFSFSDVEGKVGKLDTNTSGANANRVLMGNLGAVEFEITGGGNEWVFGYEVEDKDTDLIIGGGRVTIHFTGNYGDINYSADYKTPVTFEETDFYTFWRNAGKTGTPSYVVFGVDSKTPAYGELYTTSAKSKVVTNTMGFYYNATTSQNDLDAVTFVPSSTITGAYTETIPFTIYGGSGSSFTMIDGTVVISVNQTGSSITSVGVVFGSTIADKIAAEYKSAKNLDLSYVVFTLPSVEDGRLFSYIPLENGSRKVTEGIRLATGEKVSYTSTTGLDLSDVGFVPAANRYGTVTLYYKAYAANGSGEYAGSISFVVTQKTKSAVFSDVSGWASDSLDFLYYTGISKGDTSGKYNPNAKITRGDFMLMLYRAFLAEDYDKYSVTTNFADVTKGTTSYSQETYHAVGVAKALGIAKGTNGNYNPKDNITRQEAMTLVYRTLETLDWDLENVTYTSASSFKDYGKIASWAKESITSLVYHGVINGNNGNINPTASITRAEMGAILHRVLTY